MPKPDFSQRKSGLPRRVSFSVYDSPQNKRKVHKQGIKLPLYKNRSFSLPPLERVAVYAAESSDCVTSSAFSDGAGSAHKCQATYIWEGLKVHIFFFCLFEIP